MNSRSSLGSAPFRRTSVARPKIKSKVAGLLSITSLNISESWVAVIELPADQQN